MCSPSMRSTTAESMSPASLPAAGGATITFAPSVRNSCVSFRSASRFTLSSAEQIAAPLVSAISATARRPRLAPSNFQRIRRNIERLAKSSLSPQHGSGVHARGSSERKEASQQRDDRGQDQHDRKQNPARFGSDAKNSDAQLARQGNSERVADTAAYQCEKQLLGHKKRTDPAAARSQRFHQSNFRTPLEHRRGRSCSHGERRRE